MASSKPKTIRLGKIYEHHRKYPFAEMEIGDSFLTPKVSAVCSAWRWGRLYNLVFSSHRDRDPTTGRFRYRIRRVG